MLVHETAGIESYYPYLTHRVRPVPVHIFIGRTSKAWPCCKVKDSIWHWFKDPLFCDQKSQKEPSCVSENIAV